MRASRLLSLLLQLQLRGQATAPELAERLEVSVRTIHRDVAALVEAGVPVEAVRGPAGGYRLAGGYRTRLTGLTAAEAEALFVGPASELGLGEVLAGARLKVLAALPAELQERAERSSRLFHLDTRGWFREADRTPHLASLADGVWHGHRIDMRYREGRRVVRRRLDPLGLVLKGGAWYLVARRRGELRVYRVSRVVSARVREEGFERPPEFELASYWQEWSQAFERTRPRVEVTVRVGEAARRLLPRGEGREDGLVAIGFESYDDARRQLLGFGADVEIVEPPELRERVAEAARRTAELYAA